jgi:riboflavin biosynthesis pyrimidine reductase
MDLLPFETLVDVVSGEPVPLTEELARLYGELRFPKPPDGRPLVIANFVSTLDGVVALADGGPSGGSEISGGNRHDRLIVALLRAVADVIVVGAGTVRASPRHRWTVDKLVPELGGELLALRERLGKTPVPLVAIVSISGDVDPDLPLFAAAPDRALIVTSDRGKRHLAERGSTALFDVVSAAAGGSISAKAIVDAIQAWRLANLILIEGGPTLFGRFLAERLLDELFLTISPQIAGRVPKTTSLGLVTGHRFGPTDPRWGQLVSLKRACSHLFTRYAFDRSESNRTGKP